MPTLYQKLAEKIKIPAQNVCLPFWKEDSQGIMWRGLRSSQHWAPSSSLPWLLPLPPPHPSTDHPGLKTTTKLVFKELEIKEIQEQDSFLQTTLEKNP